MDQSIHLESGREQLDILLINHFMVLYCLQASFGELLLMVSNSVLL